ncbi:hypothetical protein FISHEDRAFT_73198 [Fistulina hepatica ATCC 64428]|uniref:Uncharacterized protein n=1 Tax=Fistulina hepatica ATCC 64428 TaxID=1128425 RepID=A0A0D7AD11_9AGAR|nr:hypothetical protein FISHEDRAFT_73198 [Fistulina hepatica ATCC 64428]
MAIPETFPQPLAIRVVTHLVDGEWPLPTQSIIAGMHDVRPDLDDADILSPDDQALFEHCLHVCNQLNDAREIGDGRRFSCRTSLFSSSFLNRVIRVAHPESSSTELALYPLPVEPCRSSDLNLILLSGRKYGRATNIISLPVTLDVRLHDSPTALESSVTMDSEHRPSPSPDLEAHVQKRQNLDFSVSGSSASDQTEMFSFPPSSGSAAQRYFVLWASGQIDRHLKGVLRQKTESDACSTDARIVGEPEIIDEALFAQMTTLSHVPCIPVTMACMAPASEIYSVIASGLFQRLSWGIHEPLLGLAIDDNDSCVRLVIGWLSDVTSTCATVNIAHAARTDDPSAKLGVYDLADWKSALQLACLLHGVRYSFAAHHSLAQSQSSRVRVDVEEHRLLPWRLDLAIPRTDLDVSSEDTYSLGWLSDNTYSSRADWVRIDMWRRGILTDGQSSGLPYLTRPDVSSDTRSAKDESVRSAPTLPGTPQTAESGDQSSLLCSVGGLSSMSASRHVLRHFYMFAAGGKTPNIDQSKEWIHNWLASRQAVSRTVPANSLHQVADEGLKKQMEHYLDVTPFAWFTEETLQDVGKIAVLDSTEANDIQTGPVPRLKPTLPRLLTLHAESPVPDVRIAKVVIAVSVSRVTTPLKSSSSMLLAEAWWFAPLSAGSNFLVPRLNDLTTTYEKDIQQTAKDIIHHRSTLTQRLELAEWARQRILVPAETATKAAELASEEYAACMKLREIQATVLSLAAKEPKTATCDSVGMVCIPNAFNNIDTGKVLNVVGTSAARHTKIDSEPPSVEKDGPDYMRREGEHKQSRPLLQANKRAHDNKRAHASDLFAFAYDSTADLEAVVDSLSEKELTAYQATQLKSHIAAAKARMQEAKHQLIKSPQRQCDRRHELSLVIVAIENKRWSTKFIPTAINQSRMYTTSVVKHYAALGIFEIPVFGIIIENSCAIVTMTYAEKRNELEKYSDSDNGEPTRFPSSLKSSRSKVHIVEHNVVKFDIRNFRDILGYATFLIRLHTRIVPRIYEKFIERYNESGSPLREAFKFTAKDAAEQKLDNWKASSKYALERLHAVADVLTAIYAPSVPS